METSPGTSAGDNSDSLWHPTWMKEDESLVQSNSTFLEPIIAYHASQGNHFGSSDTAENGDKSHSEFVGASANQIIYMGPVDQALSNHTELPRYSMNSDWHWNAFDIRVSDLNTAQSRWLPSDLQPFHSNQDHTLVNSSSNASWAAETHDITSPSSSTTDKKCCGQVVDGELLSHGDQSIKHKKPHLCMELGCNRSFTELRSLRRHVKTNHSTMRTIFCPHSECEFAKVGFNRNDSFLKHYRRKHGARMETAVKASRPK